MMHLDYRDARPIYTQIVDNFRTQIITGILQNGDRLPSVRELASQLAINPNTIQRAYRELEMGGWIATVPGKGCFICGRPEESVQERTAQLLEFDAIVESLGKQGVSKEELIARLQQGGEAYA